MTSSVVSPQQWSLPDPKRVLATLESRRPGGTHGVPEGSHWTFSKVISPVELYAYLKMRFGAPNGFAMTLRSPSVDNLVHWNYTLECPDTIIDLHGLDTQITIHAYSAHLETSDWKKLESNLCSEFKEKRKGLTQTQQEFEEWHLFVNPFRRLTLIVERYEQRLNKIDIPIVHSPPVPPTSEQMRQFHKEMVSALESYQEAMALCISLEMIAPVMGEAAVNFLLSLLAKPDIRNDERKMKKVRRKPIQERIKSLHLHCDGFAQHIPESDDRFMEFGRIMKRRNDALHGNVYPERDCGEILYFDQRHIPLPKEQLNLSELALRQMMADLSKDTSLSTVKVVREFVEFLTDSLDSDTRALARRIMDEHLLGRESKTGRIGVILPSARVAAYPSGE